MMCQKPNMTDRELIAKMGGPRALACALGVKRQRVVNWMTRGISWEGRIRLLALAKERGLDIDEHQLLGRGPGEQSPEADAA